MTDAATPPGANTGKTDEQPQKAGAADPCRDCDTVKIIALFIVAVGVGTIVAFAAVAMGRAQDPVSILNIVLPVFATWIGTIIAFYFGKENFESASLQVRESNKQVQALLSKDTVEERSKQQVSAIMKKFSEMTVLNFTKDNTGNEGDEKTIPLAKIRETFETDCEITRLPVLKSDNSPAYMIHASSIDKYLAEILSGEQKADMTDKTLADFLENRKKKNMEYGLNTGFVVVSEQETVGRAKDRMEMITTCQDIFVTKGGTAKEPLTGWISNTRLTRYLKG
jgi:hypothetical protein